MHGMNKTKNFKSIVKNVYSVYADFASKMSHLFLANVSQAVLDLLFNTSLTRSHFFRQSHI